MARNEASRAPIVPPPMRVAKSMPAATPPTAKSYSVSIEVSPAAVSVATPKPPAEEPAVEAVAEVVSEQGDDAG
jgi:hypothetical protein